MEEEYARQKTISRQETVRVILDLRNAIDGVLVALDRVQGICSRLLERMDGTRDWLLRVRATGIVDSIAEMHKKGQLAHQRLTDLADTVGEEEPKVMDLAGIAPDATGTELSEDFVGRLRDEW